MNTQLPSSPFGVAWSFLYGYFGVPAAMYLPQLRQLGGGFTKVYLFWQQIEPQPGRFDFSALDAFVNQLDSPEEGLISLFSSSQWAVKRPSAMLPPSPARNPDDYYRFVYAVVERCKGRVRYWQNDCEASNPVFWSGTREEFVAQLKVFHRAVKDADPNALVVVGGYDGLFVPPGMANGAPPFPQQEVGLPFFEYVLKEGSGAFDLFDLRLYGDPYTIVARVQYMRQQMLAFGYEKPMVCTEYGGPNLFEFPENRKYVPLINTWSQAIEKTDEQGLPSADGERANRIEQLYREMSTLAPQTQMFMQGCPAELEAKYHRIQSRSLVMRNIFALSAGVQKTLYWDLLASEGKRDDLMTLMYGKIGMLGLEDGELKKRSPAADAFARMAQALDGVRAVKPISLAGQPSIFLFQVERGRRGTLHMVWERRDAFSGEDSAAIPCSLPWAAPAASAPAASAPAASAPAASAMDALGTIVPVHIAEGLLHLDVSLTPIYIEAPV